MMQQSWNKEDVSPTHILGTRRNASFDHEANLGMGASMRPFAESHKKNVTVSDPKYLRTDYPLFKGYK